MADLLASSPGQVGASTVMRHYLSVGLIDALILSPQHVQLLGGRDVLLVGDLTHRQS